MADNDDKPHSGQADPGRMLGEIFKEGFFAETSQRTAVAPQRTAVASQGTAVAPQGTAVAAQRTAVAPQDTSRGGAAAPGGDAPGSGRYSEGAGISLGGKSYTVEKLLGSGTEGDLYIVSDKSRRYALKLCHRGFHPNAKVFPALDKLKGKGYIADIVSYGDDFELMEYFPEGNAASAGLKGQKDAILAIAAKTAMALDEMHRAGVIHKDVKPANILIRDRENWDSVLCDFGIADLLGEDGKCTTAQVRTPIYAAPEVYASGNTVVIDGYTYCELGAKADFYSLGMTILSLWMGEGAFLAKESELAIAKNKGGIAVLADMPEPLSRIVKGLLISDAGKRWDWGEILRTINGEDVPVEADEIIADLGIVYNASKHQIANTPEELAAFMVDDIELAKKYLYRGQIERWLRPYPELALEIQEIVEKRCPKDQDTGVFAAIYQLDPSYPFVLRGTSRSTGEATGANARSLKDVSDFCNAAIPDELTAHCLNGDIFKEWVRVRNPALADSLVPSDNSFGVFTLRVSAIDPLSDPCLINDPSNPGYAMTQEGIGRLLNEMYNIWWNRYGGDVNKLKEDWPKPENAPLNLRIPLFAIINMAVFFAAPASYPWLEQFFDTKGARFGSQKSWVKYCTDYQSVDAKKKCGPKDDRTVEQIAWMKVIKGFGVEPEYEFADTGAKAVTPEELFSHKRRELKKEYLERGLAGWLAVHHQDDPGADLSPRFAYERRLADYLEDLRKIDDGLIPVSRFDSARRDADTIAAAGRSQIRGLGTRDILQQIFTVVFAILPALALLTVLVFSIIENPVIDLSGLRLERFTWVAGIIIAGVIFFDTDCEGCGVPIISGVIGAFLLGVLVAFLGKFILYIYAAIVLALLIWFSIKTMFFHSRYARDARKFTSPGFDEKVLEPLYFAFSNDAFFDSSLNGAFDREKLGRWKDDLKTRRRRILIFIAAVWALCAFGLLIPKSERFREYSTIVKEKVMPGKSAQNEE